MYRRPQHEVADTSESPSRNASWLGFSFAGRGASVPRLSEAALLHHHDNQHSHTKHQRGYATPNHAKKKFSLMADQIVFLRLSGAN
jgi:hypothetical protein